MGEHRHFYDPPACPEGCADAGTDPLWGWYTVMLVEGFDWKQATTHPRGTYESSEGSAPRTKPRRIEYYTGEFIEEPEVALSNKSTTGKLINRMRMSGWCVHQADEALSLASNLGGSYYVWRCASDPDKGTAFITHFWEGSYTAAERAAHLALNQPPNTVPPSRIRRVREEDIWMERDGYTYWRKIAEQVLYFLMRNGPSTANEVQRSGSVHGRAAARYVEALSGAGLVTVTKERHLCRNGRHMPSKVIRLAPPEVVEAALSDGARREADRPLWETLRGVRDAQEPDHESPPPMTLDDIVGR